MGNEDKVEVLIVDDRPENLLAVESVIESPGLNIIKANSGNEALGLMFDHEFAHREVIERISSLERLLKQLLPVETQIIEMPARNSVRVAEMFARSAKN